MTNAGYLLCDGWSESSPQFAACPSLQADRLADSQITSGSYGAHRLPPSRLARVPSSLAKLQALYQHADVCSLNCTHGEPAPWVVPRADSSPSARPG